MPAQVGSHQSDENGNSYKASLNQTSPKPNKTYFTTGCKIYSFFLKQSNQSHSLLPISKEVQFSSVAQSCPTLCDPMNRSTPGLPVHQLPQFTQTHVHRVRDAIQPSHPLSSPSPPAPAAAKSLQSCLTLCNPVDGSPPGSPIPEILQARTVG